MPVYPYAPTPYGSRTALDISAATVVKDAPGIAITVQVITAGSAAGAVYDSTSTTGNGATNQVASIPNVVGEVSIRMPCASGIVVAPGTSQVVAIAYD